MTGVLPHSIAIVLGWLIALGFVVALASSGGTWLMGADRTYAVSALDRTAPSLFGRFSRRYGTPIAVNIMSGTMATIAMAAAILIFDSPREMQSEAQLRIAVRLAMTLKPALLRRVPLQQSSSLPTIVGMKADDRG